MEILIDHRYMSLRNERPLGGNVHCFQGLGKDPGSDQITGTQQLDRWPARDDDLPGKRTFQNQIAEEERALWRSESLLPWPGIDPQDVGDECLASLVLKMSLDPPRERGLGVKEPDLPCGLSGHALTLTAVIGRG